MFICIIEKRISSKIKKMGDPVEDRYVLMASVLPFAPVRGTAIQLESGEVIALDEVVYKPMDGTFWAEIEPIFHPKPDAKTVAEKLVKDGGWDSATTEEHLETSKEALVKKAITKLQQTIVQAQARMASGQAIAQLLHGPKRRH